MTGRAGHDAFMPYLQCSEFSFDGLEATSSIICCCLILSNKYLVRQSGHIRSVTPYPKCTGLEAKKLCCFVSSVVSYQEEVNCSTSMCYYKVVTFLFYHGYLNVSM